MRQDFIKKKENKKEKKAVSTKAPQPHEFKPLEEETPPGIIKAEEIPE